MQLNPVDFNAFLSMIGQQVLWRKAFLCPCVNPTSGAAKPGCPVCGSKGRFWADPVQTVVGVPSQKVQRQWMNFGKYDAGDMIVTLPGDSVAYDMGEFDRVLTLNATEVFQLPLVSGKNDKIAFTVVSIDQIYWIDRGVIVYGELPSIDAQGNLTWIQDKPALGVQYTICGQRRSEYFCYMDLPSNRGEHSGAPLPRNVVLKKFDLFSR